MAVLNWTCGNCVLHQRNQGNCPILKQTIPADKPACPIFVREVFVCDICGNEFIQTPIIVMNEDTPKILCPDCGNNISGCRTCKERNSCLFETDPSPLPKMVMQQIRQGNMVMQTQTKNPARIDTTCKKGCSCFSQDFGCLKEWGFCEKHHYDWEEPRDE